MSSRVDFASQHVSGKRDAHVRQEPEPGVHFDPQRRAATGDLKAAVKALSAFLEWQEIALRLRQRRRSAAAHAGFKLAVEALRATLPASCFWVRIGPSPSLGTAAPCGTGAGIARPSTASTFSTRLP